MSPNAVVDLHERSFKPAVVCLIEDNPLDSELIRNALAETAIGARVVSLCTGEDALEYLFGRNGYSNRDAHPLPELILLDLKLPGIDGHDVLREIKSSPWLRRIPVIVLTGSARESDLVQSYDGHANSYLNKPANYNGFCRVMSEIETYWLSLNVSPPPDDQHTGGDTDG